MATIAPDKLEERTRAAWSAYSERLADLTGSEYADAEVDAWDALQASLQAIDAVRAGTV